MGMSGDMAMCQNDECPLADNCWRYCAPPLLVNQWYGEFELNSEGECDYFMDFPEL
jgi:hypothetical protein